MANEIRRRYDFVAGALSADMASGVTTMNSAGLADLPAIGATEHAAITFWTTDANGRVTKKEIAYVTAHTAAATSATIVRGKDGTTAQNWLTGDKWALSPVTYDEPVICTSATRPAAPYTPMMIYETDNAQFMNWNGAAWIPVSAYQGTAAPAAPVTGDLWLDTDEGAEAGLSSILAYAEVSANQGSITAETDLTGLTVNVVVPAGRRIKITGRVFVESSVPGDTVALYIKEGATYINLAQQTGGWNFATDMRVEAVISPTAGAHTYKLTLQRSVGSGTLTMDVAAPGAYPRAFILVEDITGTLWPAGQSIAAGLIVPEAWTLYTPVWTASVSPPAIGNGIMNGRYYKIGRLVVGNIDIQFGSTTTYGSGQWFWSLPVLAGGIAPFQPVGELKAYRLGSSLNAIVRLAGVYDKIHAVYSATWPAGAETSYGEGTPWTGVNGQGTGLFFMYEAAA